MKLKPTLNKIQDNSQAGFTLVELLTVLAIMTLILGVLVIDFSRQRGQRNIVLTKNETITNLRKVQSYTLSSRNIAEGVPAKYYIITFTLSSPHTYTVQAIDGDYGFHDNIETISLPSSINLIALNTVEIDQGGSGEPSPTPHECMQIIFSAPYGKMYTNGAGKCDHTITDIVKDPVRLANISQNTGYIYFSDDSGTAPTALLELVPLTGQMKAY